MTGSYMLNLPLSDARRVSGNPVSCCEQAITRTIPALRDSHFRPPIFHHKPHVIAVTDTPADPCDNSQLIGAVESVHVSQDGPSKLPQSHFQRSLTTVSDWFLKNLAISPWDSKILREIPPKPMIPIARGEGRWGGQ